MSGNEIPTVIWKEHNFSKKYESVIPDGETPYSGPCLRNALFQAGVFTDLPHWTRAEDIESICQELNFPCFTGEGKKITLSKKGRYVVGYIVDHSNSNLRIGHYEYTTDIQSLLKQVAPKNVFVYIEIPKHS
ncbi:MAG: hypothetical protein HZA34_04340 [Candidatus Pacebacteria bacterium]|nr:hypothetical protein [Candidatus Paceibacterota bacterium]